MKTFTFSYKYFWLLLLNDEFIFSSPTGSQDNDRRPTDGVGKRIQSEVCFLGFPASCGDLLVPEAIIRSQGKNEISALSKRSKRTPKPKKQFAIEKYGKLLY